jgi:glycosyltransferase involved in cell wall biosynthesis
MKKICFIIAGFGPGGAQRQCLKLIGEISRRDDFDVSLIYFYEGINFGLLHPEFVKLVKIDVASAYSPLTVIKVVAALQRLSPDILFSWLHASDVYSFFYKVFFPRCVWVVAERDSYYPSNWRYSLRRMCVRFSNFVIANSKKGSDYWVSNGFDDSKVKSIPNIVDIPESVGFLDKPGHPCVVFAGRLEPQKNVINMVGGFFELGKSFRDGKFLVIGEGSLGSEIEKMIENAGGSGSVELIPFQSDVLKYFSAADVCVNVSFHEGSPNTVLEAISLRRCVVVSRIPEHVDILGVSYPFYIDNLHDEKEIASVIKRAIADWDDSYLDYGLVRLESMSALNVVGQYSSTFIDLLK